MAKETNVVQPKLDEDVSRLVRASATANFRSVAGEVNFILRKYYEVELKGLHLEWDKRRKAYRPSKKKR